MKYALITGGAGGLGLICGEALAYRGWTVFAADYNKDLLSKINNQNIIPLEMDVTSESSIKKGITKIKKITDHLDVVMNFAGILKMASLSEVAVAEAERVININVLGMMRVNQLVLPLILKEKGRIINISSEVGWMSPTPFNGLYTMSKYAVEAYNDTLRRELSYLDIKVIKIQPGSFKSNMHKAAKEDYQKLIENTIYYKKQLRHMGKMMTRELKNTNDPRFLIEAILHAVNSPKPKLCYRVKNSPQMTLINFFPEKTIDKIYQKSI